MGRTDHLPPSARLTCPKYFLQTPLPKELTLYSFIPSLSSVAMSTVAEDLLNDFGSSGDEAEDVETNGDAAPESMDVDGDAPAEDDDESNDLDDAEAAKAKIEKMQLAGVKDVRSVASLMETLEPVLEVSGVSPFSVAVAY